MPWRSCAALAPSVAVSCCVAASRSVTEPCNGGAQLLRGKTGRVVGGLTSMLVLLKGLPRAYNKDLQARTNTHRHTHIHTHPNPRTGIQEDKEAIFDTCKTMRGSIPIMTGVVATLKLHPEAMLKDLVPTTYTHARRHTNPIPLLVVHRVVDRPTAGHLQCPEMLATDLAEYLVRKGWACRRTHTHPCPFTRPSRLVPRQRPLPRHSPRGGRGRQARRSAPNPTLPRYRC